MVFRGIMERRLPIDVLKQLDEFEHHQRICALPGHSQLTLGQDHGFGQTYTFGPHEFRVWMDEADVKKLFANEWDRWQFIDVTDLPSNTTRPPLGKSGWKALLDSFAKLGRNRKLLPHYR